MAAVLVVLVPAWADLAVAALGLSPSHPKKHRRVSRAGPAPAEPWDCWDVSLGGFGPIALLTGSSSCLQSSGEHGAPAEVSPQHPGQN